MVVQHNIAGMNANRQLNITTGTQAKSSEKLSSGYRINRAADDAAGLAISEKMRRQIRGLTQASSNAQDGISFVQIADGALTEVHDMIQRGNELAVKAANDTLNPEDRSYIDSEVQRIIEEIEAIGGKTTFNEIPIFPKNGSAITEASPEQRALAEKIAKEMIPTAMSQIENKLAASVGGALSALQSDNDEYGMDLSISYIDGQGGTLAYMSSAFYPRDPGHDSFAEGTLLMKVDSSDYESENLSDSDMQMLQSTIAHELMHGVMDVLMPEGMYRGDTSDNTKGNFDKWFVEGTAQLIGGGFTTGWNDELARIGASSDSDAVKLEKTKNFLNKYTVEDRVYGHGYLECAYLCQLASGSDIENITQQSLIDGANRIFNALMANEENYKNGNTSAVKSYTEIIDSLLPTGKTVAGTIAEMNSGAEDAAKFALALAKATQPGDSSGLNGAGSLIAPSLNSSNVFGSTVTDQGSLYVKNLEAVATDTSEETVLYLQVGSETTSENEIALKRFALSADAIGLSMCNTISRADSLEAIEKFKSALINVSTMRSYYGAMQNRLEHTIKNLDNVVENTQASESLIRDTDMADEMVRFSNNNILAQAGQAMLAQANQTNQGVLSLLQ
ncbi:flagellinolysin [Butyrivibrio sp. VCB2006]|uniref:flagellinolysin n=1 Tax=Butyrivibrio sp. VCB2006 TaxID=1280679 RepID=UPI00041584C4|nr:flagellinolysin [Butyrivibrio sp. VCB2006]